MAHVCIIKRSWPGVKGVIRMSMKFKAKKVKKRAFVGILAGLCALGGVYYALSHLFPHQSPAPAASQGQRLAPAFGLKDRSERLYELASWRGKVTLVHFWASWCPPCLAEIAHFARAASQWDLGQVAWVAISEDQSWADAEKILPSDTPAVVSLLDEGSKVSDLFGSYQFPETYLISPAGEILAKWVGPQSWQKDGEIFQKIQSSLR